MLKMALSIGMLLLISGVAQAQQCLHTDNDNADQRQRRSDAVAAMRALNTAQVMNFVAVKKFVSFAELATSAAWAKMNSARKFSSVAGTDLLPGFELHLSTDGTKYSISLKDKTDPCLFMVYTNDVGIIYTGYPIDFRVTPSH
jgi:hypothetical protein